MKPIELEKWEVIPGQPSRLKYTGQRKAREVFEELRYRLKNMGYLPGEYFKLDSEWENGREIPKGADIFCTTDYGESEGIYLDVYLKWYENGDPITKPFITGKTLGESGSDLDRMFLTASAITKAFRGGDFHRNSVIDLNEQEQRVIVSALVEQWQHRENAVTQTKKLLGRLTGGILSYMDIIGEQPLNEGDKALLAIQDGDLSNFQEQLRFVTEEEILNELFLKAARCPGTVGRKMVMLLLDKSGMFNKDVYFEACVRAVSIVDTERVALLQERASDYVDDLPLDFFGELAEYALQCGGAWFLAEQIVKRCSTEEILAAPMRLLEIPTVSGDMGIPKVMAQKGVNGDHVLRPFIQCRGQAEPWKIKALLDMGMKVSPNNYDALAACVEYNCPEIGKALIDHGVDFEGFTGWAEGQGKDISCDTYQELAEYWQTQHQQEQGPEQSM